MFSKFFGHEVKVSALINDLSTFVMKKEITPLKTSYSVVAEQIEEEALARHS